MSDQLGVEKAADDLGLPTMASPEVVRDALTGAPAPQSAEKVETLTEREQHDLALWHKRLGELADSYYEAGRTSSARRTARAELMMHAIDCFPAENRRLRRMLCAAHHGALAYMDDGEAQDSSAYPCIDYLRDSLDDIERKMRERALAAAPAPQSAEAARVPYFDRRAVERAIASVENPPPGSLHLNDSKERVTLPGGTLRRMLAVIDFLAGHPAPVAQGEAPTEMALCESRKLVLRVGRPYVFRPIAGCATCDALAAEAREAYGPSQEGGER